MVSVQTTCMWVAGSPLAVLDVEGSLTTANYFINALCVCVCVCVCSLERLPSLRPKRDLTLGGVPKVSEIKSMCHIHVAGKFWQGINKVSDLAVHLCNPKLKICRNLLLAYNIHVYVHVWRSHVVP